MGEARVEKIRRLVAFHLEELERTFEAPYRLTFVARYPGKPSMDVVVTSDPDMDAVCASVRGLTDDAGSLIFKGTEEPAP